MKYILQKRKRLDMFNPRLKNIGMQLIFKNAWGSRRELPKFANQSFHQLGLDREKENPNK